MSISIQENLVFKEHLVAFTVTFFAYALKLKLQPNVTIFITSLIFYSPCEKKNYNNIQCGVKKMITKYFKERFFNDCIEFTCFIQKLKNKTRLLCLLIAFEFLDVGEIFSISRRTIVAVVKQLLSEITQSFPRHCTMSGANNWGLYSRHIFSYWLFQVVNIVHIIYIYIYTYYVYLYVFVYIYT